MNEWMDKKISNGHRVDENWRADDHQVWTTMKIKVSHSVITSEQQRIEYNQRLCVLLVAPN